MKKNKITGLIGTIVLHAVLLILLLVIAIRRPQMQEEGGVPVMLGNTELSQGNADPYTLTDVDIMNEPEAPAPDISEPEPVPAVDVKEEVITQTEEETVAVPKKEPKKETKKETPKKETPKKEVPKKDTVNRKRRLKPRNVPRLRKLLRKRRRLQKKRRQRQRQRRLPVLLARVLRWGTKGPVRQGVVLKVARQVMRRKENRQVQVVMEHLTLMDVLWAAAVCRCLFIMFRMRAVWW